MDTYIVTDNNVKIKDGWLYGKESFDGILNWLRSLYPGNNVFKNRTNKSLKREWACHNFLYNIHFARARTEDVDLDWPQPWYMRILYRIGGLIIWPLIP